jgi:hypothetical protein
MRVLTDEQQEADHEVTRASAALDHTRDQFVASMGALEHEITRTLDWREWVRRKPGMALTLAFGLGLFLGRGH